MTGLKKDNALSNKTEQNKIFFNASNCYCHVDNIAYKFLFINLF